MASKLNEHIICMDTYDMYIHVHTYNNTTYPYHTYHTHVQTTDVQYIS